MDFAAARRAMVDSQLRPQAVTDPLVIAAMAVVPREQFVAEEGRALAYIDRILPVGEGVSLSPPATVGRMLTELEPRPGERALVIGGGGYSAAVLAEMKLDVVAVGAGLATISSRVQAVDGPLEAGAPDAAPFDLIVIDGSVEVIPDAIVAQLKPGGRLGACMIERGVPRLVIGRKSAHGFGVKSIADAAAAPLPGFAKPKVFTF